MLKLTRSTKSKPIVGLEIEAGAVHAAEVSLDRGLAVERSASIPLAPGVVRDGEAVDVEALSEALRDMFAEHKLGRRVRIGIANQRVVVRHILLPPISDPKELATAVHFQAETEIPMPIDQAVLDHVALGLVDTPAGPRQRVLVVAARRDMIDRLLSAVRDAGLRPEGVDLSAFAMLRALATPADELVLHLSIGGGVNLAVGRGRECVFTRTVAGGLEPMALDLAERCELTVEQARLTLLETGYPDAPDPEVAAPEEGADELPPASPLPAGDRVRSAARAILDDGVRRISGEIRNSIDFHLTADASAGAPAGGLTTLSRTVLTGSAAGVPGLADALARHLGHPVEIADVAGANPAAPGSHAVAAGLAIEELAA